MSRKMTFENKSAFGKKIVKRLMEMGKNQKYLANEMGCSETHIKDILKGNYTPPLKTLYGISKITGLSIEELTQAIFEK